MKQKKVNEKSSQKDEFAIYIIYGLIFIPPFSILAIVISNIVIDYNVLVGFIMRTISFIIGLLPFFF